jgi:hypothetical protein
LGPRDLVYGGFAVAAPLAALMPEALKIFQRGDAAFVIAVS